MANYSSLSVDETIELLNSEFNGLKNEEAKKRLIEFGPNEIKKERKNTTLKIFLSQFKNAFILLLLFASILSLLLGEHIEAIAILVIICINTILGFIQEYKADQAVEALKKMSSPTAKVLREGNEQKIPSSEVVPGDVLFLEAGDIVPADSRVIELSNLQVDEASLTGESVPSKKTIEVVKSGLHISDQENMVFMGTIVTYGKGKCVVATTGMQTEFGKIATSLQETKETKTPLQTKFELLAKQIGGITILLVILVFIFSMIHGTLSFTKMLILALTLTVATIPNSLPLVVTVGLSLGTKRLAKKNMLIKKLPAAESLGAATIICSDKTGTITKNQMTITDVYFESHHIKISGSGYEPKGEFTFDDKKVHPEHLELLLKIGYLCNNAKLTSENNNYDIIGDPTEGSLVVLARKGNLTDEIHKKNVFIEELPFDSDRKRMSVIYKNASTKKTEAYVKGAPDLLLKNCNKFVEKGKVKKLTQKKREQILHMNNLFAERALRVLGLAYRDVSGFKKYGVENVEKDLIFVGLVGMIDPPREEVKIAIEKCHEAGIRVMVITGDQAITTQAIASQIGLFTKGDLILTGDDLNNMSDEELQKKIADVRIIARALPIQKSRIVDILKKNGHVVAMTGDGVNDAPALKKADIGIAMGITGTDVAKEVSKATLTDDNFATIVNAIEEGRNIYNTLIRSAKFFLASNMGEITSVFIAVAIGLPVPLLPLQILLMNMLTDNLPALGLGFETEEENIMKQPPRDPKEKPISGPIFFSIIFFGLIMGIGTTILFMQYKDVNLVKAQTVAFTTLVMFQMFAVLSSRSLLPSLKKLNPFTNKWLLGGITLSISLHILVVYYPPLQAIFGTTALEAGDWVKILAMSSLGLIMMEASKFLSLKKVKKTITVTNVEQAQP